MKIISKIFEIKIIIWRKSIHHQNVSFNTYEIKENDNQNQKFIHLLEEDFIIKGYIQPNLFSEFTINNIDL